MIRQCYSCHGHGTICPEPAEDWDEDDYMDYMRDNGSIYCLDCQGMGVVREEGVNGPE